MTDAALTQGDGYFTEANSAAVVIARNGFAKDKRLRDVMDATIRHLHALIKEVELTKQEWMFAIDFLTRAGHITTDWRQEWILLSDVLGVSMLVDAIDNRKPAGVTESTVLGPFHVAHAPKYANGANICLDGKGTPLLVSGRVLDTDGQPIAGATLDVWQANNEGFYDVQQQGIQPSMNLRGMFTAEEDGRYWFRSVEPRFYPIPDDGPVGQLLGALGRHPNRPAHIHFVVSAAGFETVTTHIFKPDCPYLHSDPVFGVKHSLIADFRMLDDGERARELGFENPFLAVEWDFVLARPSE